MKHKDLRPWLSVIAGGESLVSHAGGVLLVETARRSGLAGQLSRLLGPWRRPMAVHDPGKIVTDLAIAVALGGDAACDIAVLRAQPGVFGHVASDPTVSRLITTLAADADQVLAAISAARAAARERVWQHAGPPVQDGRVVIDMDASLVTAHSDKQDATRTWKRTFGFHPLLAFADHGTGGNGESMAELLRPGKAGSNTAVDHVAVFDAALAQVPAELRAPDEHGRVAVLVRTDAAGATKEFAAHLHQARVEFSVGASLGHFDIHPALATLPKQAWTPAYQARKPRAAEHGVQIEPRDGAWVAEATGVRGHVVVAARHPADPAQGTPPPRRPAADHRRRRPAGDRVPHQHRPRRPRPAARRPGTAPPPPRPRGGPHPGGEGHRDAQPALPRHRPRTGSGWPSPRWPASCLAWTTRLALPPAAALYEPKRLRLRILATAGRLVRTARRTTLKIDPDWPWANAITLAHTRLRALPVP